MATIIKYEELNNFMDTRALIDIGLSNTEVKVYLALIDLGSGLAGDITKKSEVNRTNVYDALERLIGKGLVTYVISANRRLFEPVNPERLNELLKEKQERFKTILPELQLKYNEAKSEEDAAIF